jgi:uncharacterized coiled-coil protein SlyX
MSSELPLEKNLCFRSETVKLLSLSVAQIHTSLTEGENSVTALTDAFKQMAEVIDSAKGLVGEHSAAQDQHFEGMTAELKNHITEAIIAFQFYDRLCQRLSHVATGLNDISELLSEDSKLFDGDLWQGVRDKVKTSYTMEAEFIMHDAILNGATVEEALEEYKVRMEALAEEENIELF